MEAFFKRALIVAQGCIMVWQLINDDSKKAIELRQFLVRLSGRQMKYKVAFTAPALLDGYLKLLSAHELLQQVTPDEIAEMVRQFQEGEVV